MCIINYSWLHAVPRLFKTYACAESDIFFGVDTTLTDSDGCKLQAWYIILVFLHVTYQIFENQEQIWAIAGYKTFAESFIKKATAVPFSLSPLGFFTSLLWRC